MIRYTLQCPKGHRFESWFRDAAAYDALAGAGQIACPACGESDVTKALMAPSVHAPDTAPAPSPLHKPANPVEEALAEMRRQIEANSDYVGLGFAAEARAIHLGEAPERSIHGEARPEEARRLIEDGIPVAPLPFLPTRKAN